jgi:hypothetical protein
MVSNSKIGLAKISVGQASNSGVKERNDDSFGVVIPGDADIHSKGIAMAIADGMSTSEGGKMPVRLALKPF